MIQFKNYSLRSLLFLGVVSIAVLPLFFLALYVSFQLEVSAFRSLGKQARSEIAAILAEIQSKENHQLSQLKFQSQRLDLKQAIKVGDSRRLQTILATLAFTGEIRVYGANGSFRTEFPGISGDSPKALPKSVLKALRKEGHQIQRDYVENGFVTFIRVLVKNSKDQGQGVLELVSPFTRGFLAEFKARHQIDTAILDENRSILATSFAVGKQDYPELKTLALANELSPKSQPPIVGFGDSKYATFLFPFENPYTRNPTWAKLALFLSLDPLEESLANVRRTLFIGTTALTFIVALLVLWFSGLFLKPLKVLLKGMREVREGKLSKVPSVVATGEFDYMIESYNKMLGEVAKSRSSLQEKISDLNQANETLKKTQSNLVHSAKMASLGQLVAGVAHELNNPIGFIHSNMEHVPNYAKKIRSVLKAYRELHSKLPAQQRVEIESKLKELDIDYLTKDLDEISKSCLEGSERVKDIVLGLRNFSRDQETQFRLTNVKEGIESTLRLMKNQFSEKISLEKNLEALPKIEACASQLNQVWMNLISNATAAIESKGKVSVSTRCLERAVEVIVEDTGVGMTPDVLERIFDPFFTTKDVGEGTGLGLSIVYGIVEKHGGTIKADSDFGIGTRFIVRLPIRQSKSKSKSA